MKKKKIIENALKEFVWTGTRDGAFQRARIYHSGFSAEKRKHVRKTIKVFLEKEIWEKKRRDVYSLCNGLSKKLTSKKAGLKEQDDPKKAGLSFGNVQKFVNLYLKLSWLLGHIEEPPHFPVDRIIQKKIEGSEVYSWTKMSKDQYKEVIKRAKTTIKKSEAKKKPSLAMWEAEVYSELINS